MCSPAYQDTSGSPQCDPDLVSDPWQIADAIPAALAELMASCELGAPRPVEDAFGIASRV